MMRRRPVGRQAALRLFVSIGLLVVLIVTGSIGIYEAALRKASQKRAEELAGFYAARLAQIEREWELRGRDFKVRVETTRTLEAPASAVVSLQAFMTIQGADRSFQYLLIQTRSGQKLFEFGKDLSLASLPANAGQPATHYFSPENGRIYRVFEYPIWLGAARGMGRFAVFFRIDNALLAQMSVPGLTLSVLRNGQPMASSGGQSKLDRQAGAIAAADGEVRELPWTGSADDPIRLRIEAPVTTLFSPLELSVSASLIPLIDGLVLWLTIGLWLTRQMRRVSDLGRAVGEYAVVHHVTPGIAATLRSARQGKPDEIAEVADAVEHMAAAIDDREREREEAAQKLRESEHRFRQLFNASNDAVFVAEIGPDGVPGKLIEVNDIACRRLGYTRAELLDMATSDIDVPEHGRPDDAEFLRRLEETGQATIERVHRAKDGRRIAVEINTQVFNFAGRRAVLGVARDITERKAVEAALVEATRSAEKANNAKSAFLANMSHEMRTPLHVIAGLGHLLRRAVAEPGQRERLEQLCATSDHLLALVDDVLDLSKIEAQELMLDRADFLLGSVVDKVASIAEERAREKGLTMAVSVAPQLRGMALNGDPRRLTQVLINLCGNAVKFTDRGTVHLRIDCAAEDAASATLRFAVEDSGIGIAAAELERLFQPFMQADSSATRERGGTGLGLAISQRLVGLMGGTIEVDSRLGAGSLFSFRLVLSRAVAPAASPRPSAARQLAAVDFQGRHVLFAEDHPMSQEILLEMLEGLGCDVEVASDGAEVVSCAKARHFDLILMDMQMPKMDGLAATRAIRALPENRDTPIVALTANAFIDDRQRCLDAGMNGHIGKPVTPAKLAASLGQWLPGLNAVEDASACDDALTRALVAIPGLEVGSGWRRSPEHVAGYRQQLEKFVNVHGQDMTRLRQHLALGERDAALVISHNLKGIAGLVDARRIALLAGELTQALRSGDTDGRILSLAKMCESELETLAEAMRALPVPRMEAVAS